MDEHRVTFTLNHLVGELNRNADRILRDEFGLTYSQFLFLLHLDSAGTVSSSVLARNMGVSRAAVSKRISWFTSRGLVRSGQARDDNRVLTLSVTPEGRRLVQEMSDVLERRFRERFNPLEEVDLEELNRTLLFVLSHLHSSREGVVAT
jgi:DNA-binding MarR family transcriptional regulator